MYKLAVVFVHAVRELQKAVIDYGKQKKKFKDIEKKILAEAQKKISVPEKRLRKQPNRYEPPSLDIDLTIPDAVALSGTDTEPLETLVPVEVEQEKIPKKKKKKTERSNDGLKRPTRKATDNLEDSPPQKKVKKSPSICNISTGIDEKILREVEKLKFENPHAAWIALRFFIIL